MADGKHIGNFDVVALMEQMKKRTAGHAPVLICCKWLKGTDGMRRQQKGRDEWRVGELIFDILRHQARQKDPKAITEPDPMHRLRFFGVPVEHEEFPPDDLVTQLIQERLRA